MSAAQKSRKIQSGLWCMLGILLFNFFFPVLVYAQEEGSTGSICTVRGTR